MLKIATCQMTSDKDISQNLENAENLIRKAAIEGCELVALPEMFALMPRSLNDVRPIAENFGDGPIQNKMAHLAKNLGIWLLAGSVALKTDSDPNRVTNSSLVYDPYGCLAARYDKIHLFNFHDGQEAYDEGAIYQPGKTPVSFNLPLENGNDVRVGLAICYDLRFPGLFRQLETPDLVVIPSAFTRTTGHAHWEVLLRARAIENLCYVCAPAQAGCNSFGQSFWGNSMVVDCWGKVLGHLGSNDNGMFITTLDTRYIKQVRANLPALNNRVSY